MPKIPGQEPDEADFNAEAKSKEGENLWSPEYSEEQRAVVASMIEITTAPDPEEEQRRTEDMARMLEDSLAHMGFKGVNIPREVQVTKDITDAIAYAISVAEEIKPEILQPLMEEKLEKMGVSIDQTTGEQLGLIAYIYKITSMRGNDGYGRSPYSEMKVARATIDILVAKIVQEGTVSVDDVIAELSKTNIKVGAEKVKKGKGNKPDVRTSAWQNTTDNTQELIRMILTEVSGKLNGNLEVDEDGKPFVSIGSGGKPAERNDLEREDEVLKEDDAMLIETIILQILGDETEEALELNPVEVGGLVSSFNLRAENFSDLSELEQAKYKNQVLDAARQVFPNIFLEENEKGLFLTVK